MYKFLFQTSTSCSSSSLEVSGKPMYFTLFDNIERPHDFSPSVVRVFHTYSPSHNVSIEMFAIQCRKESWFVRALYKGVSRQCSVCHSGRLFCSHRRDTWKEPLSTCFLSNCSYSPWYFVNSPMLRASAQKVRLKQWHFFLTFFFRFPFWGDRGSPEAIW